jgi:hypothetical protein
MASGGQATPWQERYVGGSKYVEIELVKKYAAQVQQVQWRIKNREGAPVVRRAFHAKMLAGIQNAELRVAADVPADLAVGPFEAAARHPTTVRFSNASGAIQPDTARDLRGIALRVRRAQAEDYDFLLTSAPASHARDARQFMVAAMALASRWPVLTFLRLLAGLGPFEMVRMLQALSSSSQPIDSLATAAFWSRSPFAFGETAVKLKLQPRSAPAAATSAGRGPDYLRTDLVERLKQGPVTYLFQVQRFVDERRTPIEDGSVEWKEADAPPQTIAELVIPQQDLSADTNESAVDRLEFTPWHTTDAIYPIGGLNRARRLVYDSSADFRERMQPTRPSGLPMRAWKSFWQWVFLGINRAIPWHRIWSPIGGLNLLAMRSLERKKNLIATAKATSQPGAYGPIPPRYLYARTSSGAYNDIRHPEMASAPHRFGRSVPRQYTFPDLEPRFMEPSPRLVSQRLLQRQEFIPATTLNLLAAAWIQFQVHDWIAHLRSQPGNEFEVPLAPGDDWRESPMRIRRTPPDPTRSPREAADPPTFINRSSAWWDASQVYGDDDATTEQLRQRDGGKLIIDEKRHLLPIDPHTGVERSGFTDNWWIGLSIMHTLFTREHNAIVDHLQRENPYWSPDQLFDTARLVNTALMAKIQELDWTPAILAHPTLQRAMRGQWWGLAGETTYRLLGHRLNDSESLSGIPGSPVDHHGTPYSLTEEFTAVYRMHPLIPDDIGFYSATDGGFLKTLPIGEVAFDRAPQVLDDGTTMGDVIYSFGLAHPGAITLHNYPSYLRDLELVDRDTNTTQYVDLGAVDVLRDRERGVPRYNTFRELLHRPPVRSFDQITSNKRWAEELREVYEGDVNRVDLMVGLFAEDPPKGFGFSDTAFRIFVLTNSERLKNDRFFTTDYNATVYTDAGLQWINENSMRTVLLRHYPELRPALRGVANPFAPWRSIT